MRHFSLYKDFSLGVLQTLGYLLLAFVLYLIYRILIRPKIRLQFYKKQGLTCFFYPLFGEQKLMKEGAKLYGDSEYYTKRQFERNIEQAACLNFGADAAVRLNDPALIKEYCLNPDNYVKDTQYLKLYLPLLGKGLLTSEGTEWRGQRKLFSSIFHFEHLKSVIPITQKTTRDIFHDLQKTSLKNVDIMDVFQSITGETVGKMFFGEQLNQYQYEGKPLTLALASLLTEIGTLNLSLENFLLGPWIIRKGIFPKHKKLKNKIQGFIEICHKIIQERKRSNMLQQPAQNTKDILDLLLESSKEGVKISDDEIVNQFITFFIAGMDTTGHMITTSVYFLKKFPEYEAQVLSEVRKHYGQGENVSVDDLNKLEFMTAFFKETLRMTSPLRAPFPRRAIRDHKLQDLSIKKGDLVFIRLFYNNFNPTYFPDPHTFNPNRWLDQAKNTDPYAFIPFLAGPRNCIGQHLAMLEARTILSEFLLRYNSELKEGYELRMRSTFLYEPAENILLNLTPINNY